MKRFLATFVFAIIALSTWAYDCEVDGIYYNVNGTTKEATVTYLSYENYDNREAYSGDVVIPESIIVNDVTYSVTSIDWYAFYLCKELTSVFIPNSVTSIGEYAFGSCSGLSAITIPNSVTKIERNAFQYCTGLSTITIPNSVKSIEYYTFRGCTGLTSMIIPENVTGILDGAFDGCTGLTSVTIPNTVTYITGGLSIPHSFNDCKALNEVNISLKDKNDLATYVGRTDIGDVFYTSGLSYATHNILINGEKQTSIIIPNSVTTIGEYAFSHCTALTSVVIPDSVTSIGDWAFYQCSGLTSVNISSIDAWCKISFTSESNPLEYSHNLYLNGEIIKDLNIPNSVTNIGDYVFKGCSCFASVTIPSSVTSIGYRALSGCSNVKEIHSNNPIPPTCSSSTFEGVKTANCRLYVPTGSKEDYAFATAWCDFVNIIEEEVVNPSGSLEKPTISYENKQLHFSCSTAGAKYVYTIKAEDNTASLQDCENGTVNLSATYIITAYAKTDTETSEPATATLVWATGTLETEDINEVKSFSVDALPLLISQDNGIVTISGLQNGDVITAYTTNGTEVTKSQASGSAALLNLTELQGKVAILSINGKSAKIIVK